jgi:membrane protein
VRWQQVTAPRWANGAFDAVMTTYGNWRRARTIRLGAGIAYYALFALVPIITLSIVVAQWLVGEPEVAGAIDDLVDRAGVDPSVAQALTNEIERSSTQASLGVIGFGSLVFTGVLVFFAVQDAFDEIWELPLTAGWRSIRRRLTALIVVAGGAMVLVLAVVVSTVSGIIESIVPGAGTFHDALSVVVGSLGSWAVLVGAIALVFQVRTRPRLALVPLLIGAASTAALLAVGTKVLGWYLEHYGSTSLSGAAGGVLLALVWLYYVSQMVLVGAHFTRVLDERHDGPPASDDES